jgi:GNAT superfamily N-acetyltransferase
MECADSADSVTIRLMHASDVPAGLHFCRLSGWNQIENDWRFFLDSPDGAAWVAERDGDVLGTVTFLRYGRSFSWLSMMLVHPDARRTGIGTRLIETALDALADDNCVRLDATPLGLPLYRRFGFTVEFELARAKVTVAPGSFGALPENVRPTEPGDLAEIFALDHRVFGANRSALLASLYDRAPRLAWTVRRGDGLLGYCFGRSGYLYWQLGPVVADNATVAQDLLTRCLASQPGEHVALDVPLLASDWTTFLKSVGFTIERPFLRMRRGENQCPGIPARQFGITGPEFG